MGFDWSSKKVLVTGAGGFIGSHLVALLVRKGAQVRAFVRYNSAGSHGHLDETGEAVNSEFEIFMGDIRSPEAVRAALSGMDMVFNLAAQIAIPYSYLDPRTVFETNVMGTMNIAHEVMRQDLELMIQTSTSEVFGTAKSEYIGEDHPLQGQSPYAASKISADKVMESFHRSFGLPGMVLRPFNTFGPRQSLRAVIPTILAQKIQKPTEPLKLGSLHPTRDFTFVTDTANGFIAAAEAPREKVLGQEFNLGTGKTISIGDLVHLVDEVYGSKSEVITDDQRIRPEKSEVNRLISNNHKAQEILNWQPQVSLKQGLKKTGDWLAAGIERIAAAKYHV